MSGRVRLLLIVAVLVILLGVGAAVLIPTLNQPGAANTTGTPQAQNATPRPGTAQVLPTNTPAPTFVFVQVVYAIQPIGRGETINPDMVTVKEVPDEFAEFNAFSTTEDVIGKIARTDIVREQPILTGMVTENLAGLGRVGSDAAAILPPGTRLMAIPIDGLTTAAYAVQPGDRVDAIISLLFVDLDVDFQSILPNDVYLISRPEPGRFSIIAPIDGRAEQFQFFGGSVDVIESPVESARPRLTTQMTIQDALVIGLGAFPDDGRLFSRVRATPIPASTNPAAEPTAADRRAGTAVPTAVPQRPTVISIAVSPQDAVVVAYYVEAKVPVTFALRPANETGTVTTQPVTLDLIMQRYSIALPRKSPYGIEPAIRSIRQLINSNVLIFETNTNPPATTSTGGE
ncbi:MAG: flagella basal body P-ring formation protein FlgA [Armatimonadetes bacterium]|nr:flagella basal body P-ring formation protein FlgA [Anaerolineae bacterium]